MNLIASFFEVRLLFFLYNFFKLPKKIIMAFDFHQDRETYFIHQKENATKYVIPFIEDVFPIKRNQKVLEIGCGEGGVLKAFIDYGLIGYGVELNSRKFNEASYHLEKDIDQGRAKLMHKNIYDVDFEKEFKGAFDIIILKDVIEHIHDQEKLMNQMKYYLNKDGVIFFGFPPWYMPFGGHQQILSKQNSFCFTLLSSFTQFYI